MQRVCSADQSVLACVVCGQFPVNVVETQCNPQCSPLYCWECVARLDRCVMCATTIDTEKLRPLPFIRQVHPSSPSLDVASLPSFCTPECLCLFRTLGSPDASLTDASKRSACPCSTCGAGTRAATLSSSQASATSMSASVRLPSRSALLVTSARRSRGSHSYASEGDPICPLIVNRRSHVLAHESECPNRLIACPELCGERVLAQGLQAHIDACAAKLVACRQGKCDVEGTRIFLVCLLFECPAHNDAVRRAELLAHQAVCPHRHVVCPVAALGCGFKVRALPSSMSRCTCCTRIPMLILKRIH